MMTRIVFYCKVALLVGLALTMAACRQTNPSPGQTPTPGETELSPTANGETATQASGETPIPPATSLPLAARVNGWEISLAEHQAELAMYQAAVGRDLATEDEERVLDELIDQAILAQAAVEKGFVVDEALLSERTNALQEQLGGEGALNDWIAAHGYDQAAFQRALGRSAASAWMRDQIAAEVPRVAEQIHARQVLLYSSDEAAQVLAELESGYDFGNMARKYDPVTGGDLGWFPRGYLPDAKLEQAAFSLQPDQFSSVIETLAGFHILQVIERDPQRPLDPEALLILQNQAVQTWLQSQRSQANIERLLP
ncbi:MAG: peptidylprolyl isomerase [Anaerolineales bacterium]|nr:peptidylprolyl isomerase [Anaerolineales bacterium]